MTRSKKRYWLFKSEPNTYSIDDLAAEPAQTDYWDGVRNYQARNLLRDEIQRGDGVLFYHSVVRPPGVVGTCEIVREAYPDPTQFDSRSKYHDPKSKEENPRWVAVDLKLVYGNSHPPLYNWLVRGALDQLNVGLLRVIGAANDLGHVGGTGLRAGNLVPLEHSDLVAAAAQLQSGGQAKDAGTYNSDAHAVYSSRYSRGTGMGIGILPRCCDSRMAMMISIWICEVLYVADRN